MKGSTRFINLAFTIWLSTLSGKAIADDYQPVVNWQTTAGFYSQTTRFVEAKSFLLASNDTGAANDQDNIPEIQFKKFEPPVFTGSNVHKFLGLGTLAFAIATAMAPKPPEVEDRAPTPAEKNAQDSSTHAKLGRATATLAAATVTTGLIAHWDDFHLEDGILDPDNLHALLGVAGSMAMLYAVSKAPGEGHAGMGLAGGAAMGIAIKLTW